MTVVLASRTDITLDVFERVAWGGEQVTVDPATLARVDDARSAFLRLAARPDVTIYGVTSGYGDRAASRLDADARRRQARAAAFRGATFGEPLPSRVVRGIVLARLANFLDGHGAVGARLVERVAELLEGELPEVPLHGNGGSGEILALSHLFGPLMEAAPELGEKEGLALINGSPCAAALVADAALAGRRQLDLAYDVFAGSIEAFGAPLEAYDEVLEVLWGDECETEALRAIRRRLDTAAERRSHQAPVAYRIVPRVLGQVERAVAAAAAVATVSLRSVSDNPVYVPPSEAHPDGRVLSTGGYHNAAAPAAVLQLAVSWADLCQLAERHVERLLFETSATRSDGDEVARLLLMVAVGYAEDARAAAQPVVLPRGGPGQNDVVSPAFLAWSRERSAAGSLAAVLAVLATAVRWRLGVRAGSAAPPLRWLLEEARDAAEAVGEGRATGRAVGALAERFRLRVVDPSTLGGSGGHDALATSVL